MDYRSELAAALARIADLETELSQLRREHAATLREREVGPTTPESQRPETKAGATGYQRCANCGGTNPTAELQCRLCNHSLRAYDEMKAEGSQCPRCERALQIIDVGMYLAACASCGGLWINRKQARLLTHAASLGVLLFDLQVVETIGARPPQAERHWAVKCPLCQAEMCQLAHGDSGITLDFCKEHGVWFDHGELRKVLLREKKAELLGDESSIAAWMFSALEA